MEHVPLAVFTNGVLAAVNLISDNYICLHSQEDQAPPYQIMEHVPLAVFTNGVLTALNELRHCALLGLNKQAAG